MHASMQSSGPPSRYALGRPAISRRRGHSPSARDLAVESIASFGPVDVEVLVHRPVVPDLVFQDLRLLAPGSPREVEVVVAALLLRASR